jgi:hypothetical protein
LPWSTWAMMAMLRRFMGLETKCGPQGARRLGANIVTGDANAMRETPCPGLALNKSSAHVLG